MVAYGISGIILLYETLDGMSSFHFIFFSYEILDLFGLFSNFITSLLFSPFIVHCHYVYI